MGEAIETTQTLYPQLLDAKPDLLFTLKCRQFVEMVNGTDSEVRNNNNSSNSSITALGGLPSSSSPPPQQHHHHSRNSPRSGTFHSNTEAAGASTRSSPSHSPHPYGRSTTPPSSHSTSSAPFHQQQRRSPANSACGSPNRPSGKQQQHNNSHQQNGSRNSSNSLASGDHIAVNGSTTSPRIIEAEEMDLSDEGDHSSTLSNGNSHINGTSGHEDDEEMGE